MDFLSMHDFDRALIVDLTEQFNTVAHFLCRTFISVACT